MKPKFSAAKSGDELFSNYAEQAQPDLSLFGILNVSSIELVLNTSVLREKNVLFDENFGLGAKFSNALEQGFLDNVRKAKLQIAYYPEVIVNHPEECSGRNDREERLYYVNGALAQKMFGSYKLWAPVYFFFKLKQGSIKFSELSHYYKYYKNGGVEYKRIHE